MTGLLKLSGGNEMNKDEEKFAHLMSYLEKLQWGWEDTLLTVLAVGNAWAASNPKMTIKSWRSGCKGQIEVFKMFREEKKKCLELKK